MKKFIYNLNPLKVMNVWRDKKITLKDKITTSIPLVLLLLIVALGAEDGGSNNRPSTPEQVFNYITSKKFKQFSKVNTSEDEWIYEYKRDSTYVISVINKRSNKIIDVYEGTFYTGKTKYLGNDGEFLYIKTWSSDSNSSQYNGGWGLIIYKEDVSSSGGGYLIRLSHDQWEGFDEFGPRVQSYMVEYDDMDFRIEPEK